MTSARAITAALFALLLAALVTGAPSAARASSTQPARPSPRRVILVIASGLEWRDITASRTPTMWRLASTGTVADLNARSRVREPEEPPSPLEGAYQLSAGNLAAPIYAIPGAFDATESVNGTPCEALFARATGQSVGSHGIAFLGMDELRKANAESPEGAVVGVLGQAVHDAGGVTAAIGNSDSLSATGTVKTLRPAAAAVMDESGLVDVGDVSRRLLTTDLAAPYGLRTDLAAFEAAFTSAERAADAHGGPQLIALDPGDEYRTLRFSRQAKGAAKAAQRAEGLRETDAVVAMALAHARPGDVVIVAGQAPAEELPRIQGFSPLLVYGDGTGLLTSPSTHRAGIVTNPDLTAYVLAALGAARPASAIGTPWFATHGPAGGRARIAALSERDRTAVSILAMGEPFAPAFISAFLVLAVLTAAFVAGRSRLSARVARYGGIALKAAALALLATLVACWAMFLPTRNVASTARGWLMLAGTTAVLWAVALVAWRLWGERVAFALLPCSMAALLIADQLLGAPLSFTNLLGYSPLQSARYYGIGNEAAALVMGCAMAASALALDSWRHAPWAQAARRYAIPLLGLLVIVTSAAPQLGANIGVAVWATIGFAALWLYANGRRMTWRGALAALALAAVLVTGFAAADVVRGGEKTHVARALSATAAGGLSPLLTIVSRKALTSWRLLLNARWPLMLAATLGLLGVARWRRPGLLTRLFAENPVLAAVLVSGAWAGAIALVTEDTGILVPTFLLLPVGLVLVGLLVGAADTQPAS